MDLVLTVIKLFPDFQFGNNCYVNWN